jgi:copper resistance protein B
MLRLVLLCALLAVPTLASSQTSGADPEDPAPFGDPVMDEHVYLHVLADQLEDRIQDGEHTLHWDADAWVGGDWHRLWLKSEGDFSLGEVEEGRHELLYSRPITRFFDLQAGVRYDLSSETSSRGWLAFGVQGLAPLWFEIDVTGYVRDAGDVAAQVKGSYDVLLTQRLILQPEVELDFYGQPDDRRRVGSGLSELDAGVRIRYEWHRKLAPYVGVTYTRAYGKTADFIRDEGRSIHEWRWLLGVRAWF